MIGWFNTLCIKFIVVPFTLGALYNDALVLGALRRKEEEHSFTSDFVNMFNFYDEF